MLLYFHLDEEENSNLSQYAHQISLISFSFEV